MCARQGVCAQTLQHPQKNARGGQAVEVDADAALRLAAATGLSVYDASYLWLARERDADLITLDRRLAAAYRVSPGTP